MLPSTRIGSTPLDVKHFLFGDTRRVCRGNNNFTWFLAFLETYPAARRAPASEGGGGVGSMAACTVNLSTPVLFRFWGSTPNSSHQG